MRFSMGFKSKADYQIKSIKLLAFFSIYSMSMIIHLSFSNEWHCKNPTMAFSAPNTSVVSTSTWPMYCITWDTNVNASANVCITSYG